MLWETFIKIIFLFILICIVGCRIVFYNNTRQDTTTFSSAASIETKEIQLCDDLELTADENVAILDAYADKLLITTYIDYTPEDSRYREEGYNSYSKSQFIYDWKTKLVVKELSLPSGELCTNGIIIDDDIIYTLLKPTETGSYHAEIVHSTYDSESETIFECTTSNTSYSTPQLVSLNNGVCLFTYFDLEEKNFGIQSFTKDGTTAPVYTSSRMEDFIGTEISANGSQFIYYVKEDGKPSLLVGDQFSILSSFALDAAQSMHSFGITDHYVFAALQRHRNEHVTDEVYLYRFDGTILYKESHEQYFNPTFDMSNGLFATDMHYNAYAIAFLEADGDETITVSRERIDIPNDSALFHPIDQNTCLISSGDVRPKLIEVTACSGQ